MGRYKKTHFEAAASPLVLTYCMFHLQIYFVSYASRNCQNTFDGYLPVFIIIISVVELEPDFLAGAGAGENAPAPGCFAGWLRGSVLAK